MILPEDTPPSPTKVQRELAGTARTTNPTQDPGPPPYNAAYASYQRQQPVYPVPSSSGPQPGLVSGPSQDDLERIARRRAGKRFLRAFIWAVAVYALFMVFIRSLIEVANPRRGRWFRDIDERQDTPGWPIPADGVVHRCFSRQDPWHFNTDLPAVSFNLPASADALYLFSRGSLATGNIMFQQDDKLTNDTVVVSVVVSHRTSETAGLVSICSLERKSGERGIGFFTPNKWHQTTIPVINFAVVVRFPATSSGEVLKIKGFETDLPHFSHHLDSLHGKVEFDSLSLTSTNAHMNVASVKASATSVTTTNGHIVGNFTAHDELKLTTTNSVIAASVKLLNAEARKPTTLSMTTTNGALSSYIDLISEAKDGNGGAFDVNARTTNNPLSISFPASPLSAHLDIDAATTNAPATVSVNTRFEGAFHLHTSSNSGMIVHYDDDAEDPEGLGRVRYVDMKRRVRGALEGTMTWGRKSGAQKLGDVDVKTTNAQVMLSVL